MKFSLKTLAAVVALAAAAGSASAAIDNGAFNPVVNDGNGELFFSAWDGVKSYNYDMNISINAFETAVAATGKVNLAWGTDFTSSYGSWLTNANTSSLQWSVLATDTDGQRRILTTVGATLLPANNNASDVLRTAASNIQTYINNVNPILTGDFAVTESNSAASYAGKMGDKIYGKFNFDTSASFANDSYADGVAFQKTLANSAGFTKGTNNAYFDDGVAVRSWVDSDGLHIAAVPEPSEYAMLLAGLGLMGVVARRRSQNQA